MAAPTVTDLTAITTEALKQAGYSNPSPAQLTRAQIYWIREVKSEIFSRMKKPMTLQVSSALVTSNGKSRYSNPTDYARDMTLTAIHGTKIGTAAGGAVGSVTLAAGHGYTEAELLGKEIFIYAGTGAGSLSQCTALSGDVASVTPNFTTAPTSGSSYMIVEQYIPLRPDPIWDRDRDVTQVSKGEPQFYFMHGDSDYGEFELWPIPYNATAPYGIKMRYFADLKTLDTASTALSTFYQKYEALFIQGVLYRAFRDKNDAREEGAKADYYRLLNDTMANEPYGMDLSNLQMAVSE